MFPTSSCNKIKDAACLRSSGLGVDVGTNIVVGFVVAVWVVVVIVGVVVVVADSSVKPQPDTLLG